MQRIVALPICSDVGICVVAAALELSVDSRRHIPLAVFVYVYGASKYIQGITRQGGLSLNMFGPQHLITFLFVTAKTVLGIMKL